MPARKRPGRTAGRVPIRGGTASQDRTRAKSARSKRAKAEPPRREPPPRRESRRRGPPGGEPDDHVHAEHPGAPPASPFMPGMAAECLVCPICVGLYALRQSGPEAMEHLMAAGYELFLAFRAVVEATGDRWDQVNTLQRITVR